MEQELISIIVPIYNIKEYLPRCVETLCAQTYRSIEIILVDDGSTDGTGELCDRLSAQDARIRVFHKENGGSSSARNLGLKVAKGRYLGFVDSDDYVSPEMYELLQAALNAYDVMAAQIGRDETDEQGNRMPDVCQPPEKAELIGEEAFLRELLMHRGDCSFCTKLFRRELFEGLEFPVGALNEDFRLLVMMLPRIKQMVSLPQQAYHVFYRMGSNTRRKSGFSRVYEDIVNNADWVSKIVEEQYPQLSAAALRFGIFQRLDYLLHVPIEQMHRGNEMYLSVLRFIRKNWWRGMKNPYLTRKNKCYLTIFAAAPAAARRTHRALKNK